MESPILKQISKFLQDKKRYKRWLAVFVCLAVVVGFATTAALKMRGKAMTHDERVLACKLEMHQHTETCYDQEKNLICGYADFVIHKHNDDCYDPNNGNLLCTLSELEAHQHTDECYQEQEALTCGLEESEGHQHIETCYTQEQGKLTCQVEEHAHAEECYGEDGTLVCEKEDHAHVDVCYEMEEKLACQQEESEGHKHTAECSQVQKTLICQKPEIELHIHGDECYERVLITPEGEEIVQEAKDNKGVAQEVLAGTADKEVPEGRIVCRRICGKLQVEEHIHTQEFGCIEIHEALDGTDLNPAEEPADGTEDGVENGAENEEQGLVQTPWSGIEEGGKIVRTFEGEGFTVTAEYKKDANIPGEAELRAEQITAESDETHYAEREAEFKKNLDDENATMKVLLKVGFYVGEQEIEPQSPVTLTVQLLGEDGLPEGTPMTVIHFAEEGTERLEGSKAENDATSFEMKGFSEIAIGYGEGDNTANEVRVQEDGTRTIAIDQSYEYETKAVHMAFHIVGDITLPEGKGDDPSESEKPEDSKADQKDEEEGTVQLDGEEAEGESAQLDGEEAEGESAQLDGEEAEGESAQLDVNDGEEEAHPRAGNADMGTAAADVEGAEVADAGEDMAGAEKSESMDETKDAAVTEEEASIVEDGNENPDLKFKVKPLGERAKEHEAVNRYLEEENKTDELLGAQLVMFSLTYEGMPLDLSECKVTATVTPSKEVLAHTKSSISEAVSYLSSEKDAENVEEKTALVITALGVSGEEFEVSEYGEILLDGEGDEESADSEKNPSEIEVEIEGNILGVAIESVVNPPFTVQYYAWLDRVVENDAAKVKTTSGSNNNVLTVIDTDQSKGGQLPQNGDQNPKVKNIYVNTEAGEDKGKVITDKILTEIYAVSEPFEYVKAPNINYFNVLLKNGSYELKEVWKLKNKNGDVKSTNPEDWYIYDDLQNLHFTNKEETANGYTTNNEKYVWIDDNAVIRLVYNVTVGTEPRAAKFYDYDISDGYTTSGKVSTMKTKNNGINSYLKGATKDAYAFGNKNCGTQYGEIYWNGNQLNKGNERSYKKCTFGLVSGVTGDEQNPNVKFNVTAPNIFGKDSIKGKKVYDYPENGLTFSRNGDTYTLVEAANPGSNGARTTKLDTFANPKCGATTHYGIWTNSFWPMDKATDRKDMMFGKFGQSAYQKYSDGSLPPADDGLDHNCFFGMYYSVEFELSKDYVGPLEYYFFGDDDMWVFLDDETLVCDIGGVHSSVGEYVNLWDYLKKGSEGKHTLKFFYTERGASGSSCWMQFTLPSVTNSTPERDFGALRVSKQVTDQNGTEWDNGEEFTFDVKFTDKDGNQLRDDFSYWKYDADGNFLMSDVIIWTGRSFKLKKGEYIIINFLPIDSQYEITEREVEDCETEINGTAASDRKITGAITEQGQEVEVQYTNKVNRYTLPKTGGPGINLYTMAGAAAMLLGAGFLYRKKFREGRVGGSS